MQTSTGDSGKLSGVPPQPSQAERPERDEDSGLHDIRSMASSTKMRLSSKRSSTHPPIDEDVLASSSAGWKAVALPEPAKMVSLPDVSELKPLEEAGSERKSKKEIKAERISAKQIAKEAVRVESSPVPAPKPALAELAPAPVIGARFAQKAKQGSSKTGLYALVGVGLAAAAGVGWYVSTQMGGAKTATDQVAAVDTTPTRARTETTSVAASAPGAGDTGAVAAVESKPTEPTGEPVVTGIADDKAGAGEEQPEKAEDKAHPHSRGAGGKAQHTKKDEVADVRDAVEKTDPPKDVKKGGDKPEKEKKDGEEGEPSFDALLKEAGVPEGQKQKKIVLEKKSLSSTDIKKGMGAVTGKAQACYAGTQGTAQVRLTVAPTGQIQKVAVTGVFAGTPVGACVETAVKGATFPAWDGGPQTFGYSYLLAE